MKLLNCHKEVVEKYLLLAEKYQIEDSFLMTELILYLSKTDSVKQHSQIF